VTLVDDIVNLTGWAQRSSTVRFELLDRTNSYLGVLDIDKSSIPSIENSINRSPKRQMNGFKLPPSTTAEVNTLTERVKPVWIHQTGDEDPLGIFLFADASRHRARYGSAQFVGPGDALVSTTTLVDQLMPLNHATGGVTMYRPGTSIAAALTEQLEVSGVISFDVEESNAKITGSAWMVWHPNITRLQIINDLCQAGGYYTLFFDNAGVGRCVLVPDLDASNPDFEYSANGMVKRDTIVESDDLLDAPNRYLVINSSLTDGAVWGYWDVPPSAPHSFENTGIRKVKQIDMQGPETMEDATAAAKAYGQADFSTYRWVNFVTAPNPRHDTYNIVEWQADNYREQSWRLPLLEGSDMNHELRRVWATQAPGVAA
jgi:hypothetical protein